MGARGPIPSRDDDLARPRSRNGRDAPEVTKGEARPTRWPAADPEWHSIARNLYNAAKKSGQSDFYQQSDIAMLWSLCEDLSVYKQSTKRSGQMLQTIYSSFSSLLITEGERRRVRIELHEPDDGAAPASVTAISAYKAALAVSAVPPLAEDGS